jgi:hypothetical protein
MPIELSDLCAFLPTATTFAEGNSLTNIGRARLPISNSSDGPNDRRHTRSDLLQIKESAPDSSRMTANQKVILDTAS